MLLCLLAQAAFGELRVASIFSDGMVIQQKSDVAIWGWAERGQGVSIQGSWMKKAKAVRTGDDGRWRAEMKSPLAGGPFVISVKAGNENIAIGNVMSGEVWVCSGQSNMQMKMLDSRGRPRVLGGADAIKSANYPRIRFFDIENKFSASPLDDVNGIWRECSPETVGACDAVAYFFARELITELDVPVGLIQSEWGGTSVAAWTSTEVLMKNPEFPQFSAKVHNAPAGLYNGMIAPIVSYGIKGAIWYQGESDRSRPILYRKQFPAMIKDWRKRWGIGGFPFYYVQIAPFGYKKAPSMALREAQMMTLKVRNTGMACTMDVGEEKNIHPKAKEPVGRRLAFWALAKDYGKKDIVYSGPIYKKMKVRGNRAIIYFNYANGGLVAGDGGLKDFEIAGTDRKFIPAMAVISGKNLIVSSEQVSKPAAVRYGWKNWVVGSLFNDANLPASSFRTDDWPLEK